jgi:hypothetical protein
MLQVPKAGCELNAHLTLWQQEVLHDAMQELIEEGKGTLQQHLTEFPTESSTPDNAEEYSNLVAMQKQRLEAYHAILAMLEEE